MEAVLKLKGMVKRPGTHWQTPPELLNYAQIEWIDLVAELHHQQLCHTSAERGGTFLGLQQFLSTPRQTTIVVSRH